jgi:hypothetical protein
LLEPFPFTDGATAPGLSGTLVGYPAVYCHKAAFGWPPNYWTMYVGQFPVLAIFHTPARLFRSSLVAIPEATIGS